MSSSGSRRRGVRTTRIHEAPEIDNNNWQARGIAYCGVMGPNGWTDLCRGVGVTSETIDGLVMHPHVPLIGANFDNNGKIVLSTGDFFDSSGALTVAWRSFPRSGGSTSYPIVWSFEDPDASDTAALLVSTKSSYRHWTISYDSGGVPEKRFSFDGSNQTEFDQLNWSVLTFDGGDISVDAQWNGYQNGFAAATASSGSYSSVTGSSIGSDNSDNFPFHGEVFEVRVYQGVVWDHNDAIEYHRDADALYQWRPPPRVFLPVAGPGTIARQHYHHRHHNLAG